MTNGRLTCQSVNSLVYQEHNVFLSSFPSNRRFLNETSSPGFFSLGKREDPGIEVDGWQAQLPASDRESGGNRAQDHLRAWESAEMMTVSNRFRQQNKNSELTAHFLADSFAAILHLFLNLSLKRITWQFSLSWEKCQMFSLFLCPCCQEKGSQLS